MSGVQPDRQQGVVIDDEACRTFSGAVELAGKKWNAAILLAIARGASRFSEVRRRVDGISDRLLSARLQELERSRLITRTVVPTTPVRIDYRLTASGEELIRLLQPLIGWAHRRQE